MKFYICYTDVNRINAIRLDKALNSLGVQTNFIDRGDASLRMESMQRIMDSIKSSDGIIILHSEDMNVSMLSQIEITYAQNLHLRSFVVNTERGKISESITFTLSSENVFRDTNMVSAARKIVRAARGGAR